LIHQQRGKLRARIIQIPNFPFFEVKAFPQSLQRKKKSRTAYINYSAEIMTRNPDFVVKKHFYNQNMTVNQEHQISTSLENR